MEAALADAAADAPAGCQLQLWVSSTAHVVRLQVLISTASRLEGDQGQVCQTGMPPDGLDCLRVLHSSPAPSLCDVPRYTCTISAAAQMP